jgi:ubiquinone/menaquinone biosynthesis C-methylase UbiE
VFGDTLHPGGLGLTNQLARLMDIRPREWVADLASGRGASALAVSRVFHCNVLGVEFGAAAVAQARAASQESPAGQGAFFVRGDAEYIPLRPRRFDGVFCECSMSLFSDKATVVGQVAELLRPGGRFGLSDVTLTPGSLPLELDGTLSQLLCLSDALDVQGYADLLTHGGLRLVHRQDASMEILKIMDDVESKLGAYQAWQTITGQAGAESELLETVPQVIATLRQLVEGGQLGYWLFVAEKPGRVNSLGVSP